MTKELNKKGPYRVIQTRYWYGPRETTGLVLGDRGEPMEFADQEEASAWIENAMREVYYLAHGEYERPSYKVVTAN